jgi:hypothetical protein
MNILLCDFLTHAYNRKSLQNKHKNYSLSAELFRGKTQ